MPLRNATTMDDIEFSGGALSSRIPPAIRERQSMIAP